MKLNYKNLITSKLAFIDQYKDTLLQSAKDDKFKIYRVFHKQRHLAAKFVVKTRALSRVYRLKINSAEGRTLSGHARYSKECLKNDF